MRASTSKRRTGREHLVDERDCVKALVVKRVGLSPPLSMVSVNADARWRGIVAFFDDDS